MRKCRERSNCSSFSLCWCDNTKHQSRAVSFLKTHIMYNIVVVTLIVKATARCDNVVITSLSLSLSLSLVYVFIFFHHKYLVKLVGIAPSNVPPTGQIVRADRTSGTVRVQLWRDIFGFDGFKQRCEQLPRGF